MKEKNEQKGGIIKNGEVWAKWSRYERREEGENKREEDDDVYY